MPSLEMHLPAFEHHGSDPLFTMSFGTSSSPLPPENIRSPDFYNTQELLRNVLRSPQICLQHVTRLGGSLHRIYIAVSVDGTSFVIKCPARRTTHLLRHEQQYSLKDESQLLKLIATAPEIPIPRAIHSREHGGAFGPYLLRSYIPGIQLSQIAPHLSEKEKSNIYKTLGYFLKRITSCTAGTFGPSHPVFAGEGQSSWREAFHQLLESTLRDAEDMLISIPYESIRAHFRKHESILNQITISHLVPMQAGLAHNVLIDQRTKQVSGLIGFSDIVWGDPMLSPVFAEASQAFWDGFGMCPLRVGPEKTRQLLYTMYRALVMIVSNCYRPVDDDSELEARRSLTWSLNQLDTL